MGSTIEELDFKLVIDDKSFDEKIAKAEEKANKLNSTISKILETTVKDAEFNIKTDVSLKKVDALKEAVSTLKRSIKESNALTITIGESKSDIVDMAKAMSGLADATDKVMKNFANLKTSVETLKAYTAESKAHAAAMREAANVEKLKAETTKAAIADVQKSIVMEKLKAAESQKDAAALKVLAAEEAKEAAAAKKRTEVLKELAQAQKTKEAGTKAEAAELRKLAQQEALNERQERRLAAAKKKSASSVTNEYRTQSRLLSDLKSMATMYFSAYGVVSFLRNLVNISAEFERQRTALSAIIQDTNKGNALFEQIKNLAVKSPFSVQELTAYTKQLSAYNIPANELYDTMKMLADVSAGLGVDMNRIVLAYGQIKAASFLRGQEVRQLTEAGIPILTELAKQFEELEGKAISAGEVFDRISKRQVTFEMVEKVFKNMTSAGGKFFQMQEVLAETLSGKLSNLKDAYQIMLDQIGEKNSGGLNRIVDLTTRMLRDYKATGTAIATVTVAYQAYKLALLATATAMGKLDKASLSQKSTLVSLFKWVKTNPYVALAAVLATVTTAIITYARTLSQAEKIQKSFTDTLNDYNTSAASEISILDAYIARIKMAKDGTEEYYNAKAAFENKYGTYLDALRQEGVAVDTLYDKYIALADKIRESNKERFLTAGRTEIETKYGDAHSDVMRVVSQIAKNTNRKQQYNLTKGDEMLLFDLVTGTVDISDPRLKEQNAFFADLYKFWDKPQQANNMIYNQLHAIQKAKEDFAAAKEAYETSLAGLEEALKTKEAKAATAIEPTLFMATVRGVLSKNGLKGEGSDIFDLWMADTMSSDDYKQKIRGRFKELMERKLDLGTTEKAEAKMIDQELAILEELFNELGISKTAPTVNSYEKEANQQESQAERDLKSQISLLQDLAEAYSLIESSITNAAEAEAFLKSKFGEGYADLINGLNFDEKIAAKMVALAALNPNAVETMVGREGLNAVREYVKAKSKREEFDTWLSSLDTTSVSGENYSVAKILERYRDSMRKNSTTKSKNEKHLRDTYDALFGTESALSAEDFANAMAVINAVFEASSTDAQTEGINNIDKAAEAAIRVAAKIDGINLSDASMKQLMTIIAALKNMSEDDLNEFSDGIAELGGNAEEFTDKWKELVKNIKSGVDKQVWQGIKEFIDLTHELSDSIADLLEATDNGEAAKALSFVGDAASKIVGGFVSGGQVGAAVAASTVIVSAITKIINKQNEARQKLKDAMQEYRMQRYDEVLNGESSIFGANAYKVSMNARKQASLIQNDISNILGKTVVKQNSAKQQIEVEKSALDILNEKAARLGITLFDSYGNIDLAALKAIQDSQDWGKKWTDIFDELIPLVEQFEEATKKAEEAMGSMLGNVASSTADAIIDEWISMGDAAADYSNIIDNVAKSYAKMLIQNELMDSIFNDEATKKLTSLFQNGDYEGFMELFDHLMTQVGESAENLVPYLEGFNKYFTGGNAQSMQQSLTSLTEDTGSLLASYMNAVRADVSYGKQQRESILSELKALTGLLPSAPNLAYYMTQIEAHSANTAENTRAILERLNSVMTTNGGANAIRTYM